MNAPIVHQLHSCGDYFLRDSAEAFTARFPPCREVAEAKVECELSLGSPLLSLTLSVSLSFPLSLLRNGGHELLDFWRSNAEGRFRGGGLMPRWRTHCWIRTGSLVPANEGGFVSTALLGGQDLRNLSVFGGL